MGPGWHPGRVSSSSTGDLARVEKELLARWPESGLEPSLTRINALVDLLGSPHRAMPVVQVAGTNGKTSTARMIDELLRGFGLRVGRFTSPHLQSIRERIVAGRRTGGARAFRRDLRRHRALRRDGRRGGRDPDDVLRGHGRRWPTRVRRCAGRRRRHRGRHGGHVGRHQRGRRTGRRRHARRRWITPSTWAGRAARSRARRPGSSRRTRSPSSPTRNRGRSTPWSAGRSRWRPSVAREGTEFGVAGAPGRRRRAAGARCRVWAESTTRSSCRCSAPTRHRTP